MSKKINIYAELDNFVEENKGQVTLTDIAKHFTNYGYKNAIDKVYEWIEAHLLHAEADGYMTTDLFKQLKQFVEE